MKILSRKVKKNFTIIESLLAIFILTIGFVSVTQLFPIALRTEKDSEMATKATELGQAKVEDLISRSYDEVKCTASVPPCDETENPVAEDNAFRRVTSIIYVNPQDNFAQPSPTSTDTGIKKVDITLFWKSVTGTGDSSIKISTLIVRK